jgi:hypothetical protein
MTDFDESRAARIISAALAGDAGITLVVTVFSGIPGVTRTAARRGLFGSTPERIQIGDWRYELARDGRLRAAHIVGGIVIAEEALSAAEVGPNVARALGQIAARFGSGVLPQLAAALEVLESSAGHGY